MPLPTRSGLQDNIVQRRSEELIRTPSGAAARRDVPVIPHRTSFDSAGAQPNLPGQGFGGTFQELLPLDVALARGSADSSSTPGSVHRHPQAFQQASRTPGGPVNPLYKLDAMMFPPGDPFAYPNPPLVDAANYHGRPATHSGIDQAQDASQFFMPSVYDDIEGHHLLGPIPPYLVAQGQHAMDPTSQLYDTSSFSMQHGRGARSQQQQLSRHRQQLAQRYQQQQDMMEDILVDANFQNDWEDMIGNSGYR